MKTDHDRPRPSTTLDRLRDKLDNIKAAQDAIIRAMRDAEGPPCQAVQDAADVLILWLSAQAIGPAQDVVRVMNPKGETR